MQYLFCFSLTFLVQLDNGVNRLRIKSDYLGVEESESKNLDTWMYTNSTEVFLHHDYDRFGQIKTNKIIERR